LTAARAYTFWVMGAEDVRSWMFRRSLNLET